MSFRDFVVFVLIGALAGWICGLAVKGRGFGPIGNIVIGIGGAFLANFCFGLLGIVATGLLGRLIFAFLGALVLVWLLRRIKD